MMDLTKTIEADSTQINADDMVTPRTVTITGVSKGTPDQPVNFELAEFPDRAYRPCKSMRRVLVHAWGSDAAQYIGRRMTLFNDPSVKWGGSAVGGLRISHLSHIDKRLTLALTVTRGRRAPFVVDPLPDAEPDDAITKAQLQQLSTLRQRAGYADDEGGRADWCQWVQSSIGRLIGTNRDLTGAEATVLIDLLENPESPEPEGN
jgi:hypothetical protein